MLRSVPELVWALVFVRVVGLGPTAGVLAIALTYGGMLGKVYGEILESGETHATETLLRNGSSRLQAFFYGLLPQNAAELTSYTVYRWECAIRSSVVLGFVGAGGLGQQMDNSMKMFNGGEVLTMLAVFVALVALADRVSAGLRRALGMSTAPAPRARGQPALPAAAAAVRRALQGLLVHARRVLLLVVASFWTLDLQWGAVPVAGRAAQHGPLPRRVLPARHLARLPAQGAAGHLGDAGHVGAGHRAGRRRRAAAGAAGQPAARRRRRPGRARRRGCC